MSPRTTFRLNTFVYVLFIIGAAINLTEHCPDLADMVFSSDCHGDGASGHDVDSFCKVTMVTA